VSHALIAGTPHHAEAVDPRGERASPGAAATETDSSCLSLRQVFARLLTPVLIR